MCFSILIFYIFWLMYRMDDHFGIVYKHIIFFFLYKFESVFISHNILIKEILIICWCCCCSCSILFSDSSSLFLYFVWIFDMSATVCHLHKLRPNDAKFYLVLHMDLIRIILTLSNTVSVAFVVVLRIINVIVINLTGWRIWNNFYEGSNI